MTKFLYSSDLKSDTIMTPKGAMLIKQYAEPGYIRGIDQDKRTVDFIISTGDVDRDGDTISVKGWELTHFKKNPVVLWAHDHRIPAIAQARQVKVQGGKLVSLATKFTEKDEHEFGFMTFKLLAGGFLNTTSVGFVSRRHEHNNDRGGIDFIEQELLEFSLVNVPSNPEALIQARAKGIDLKPMNEWARRTLDEWKTVKNDLPISRHQVELVRKNTLEGEVTYTFGTKKLAGEVMDHVKKDLDSFEDEWLEKLKTKVLEVVKSQRGIIADEGGPLPFFPMPEKKTKPKKAPTLADLMAEVRGFKKQLDAVMLEVRESNEGQEELQDLVARAMANLKVPHGAAKSKSVQMPTQAEITTVVLNAVKDAMKKA